MNNQIHIKKSFAGIGLGIILLLVACMFQIEANAQKKDIPDSLKLESYKTDTTTHHFFKWIFQPVKFKYNREKRIHDYMLEQIKNGRLKISPATVDAIMNQLKSIKSANTANSDSINSANKLNKKSFDSAQKSIDSIVNNLRGKASKSLSDSLQVQMSAVIQENLDNNNQEKRLMANKVNKLLEDIEKVQYSLSSGLSPIDSTLKGDTLRKFKRYLIPKIKIIGWHNARMNNEFKNYNYNYLSAINLSAYELSATGVSKNPEDILKFQAADGIIALAQSQGCDVHLTVHTNNADSVSKFLNNDLARKTFLSELDKLIGRSKLKGINIYFESIKESDSKHFVQFITALHENLKNINEAILLNITLPTNKDDESLKKIAAYNFSELNAMVIFYFILTDDLLPSGIKIAQSSSPLYKSDIPGENSIESAIDFYLNGKIPISKLIMTVSYSGREWKVDNFTGIQNAIKGKSIRYAEIVKEYSNQKDSRISIREEFELDQVSAYLNIIGPNPEDKKQLWFDDSRSLFQKYDWAFEKKLGGVAIRWLGYDDGRSELWKSLGAALIKIETVEIPKSESTVRGMSRFWTILNNARKGFKLKIFWQDLEWAGIVRLKYYDKSGKEGYLRFDNTYNSSVGSVKDTVYTYIDKPIIWRDTCTLKYDTILYNEAYQKNKSFCYSLYSRWTIYSKFFLWCSIFFSVFAGLFAFISFYLERYLIGGKEAENIRSKVRNIPYILIFLTVITIGFWRYLDPSVSGFGAGSVNGPSSILMIYILILGIVLSWFFASNYYKYKRTNQS
ncbi:MAG TPA: hypothetical protein DCR40_05935 [Prolixibacteraceae bacterium]|nr:hypothetical protein [Prolixibacteraceae bacterium]